jgi:hypothetical protein
MAGRDCDFELRGYRSSDGGIDVYAYSQHDNHPFQSDGKCDININTDITGVITC